MSGARLRRCLISSKTVEISRAKFHKIQKTNNAHDVTMPSNAYRFSWKVVIVKVMTAKLLSKVVIVGVMTAKLLSKVVINRVTVCLG